MKNNVCLIYNYGQHYRLGIFKLLDMKLDCDFYFGDKMHDVKKIDYNQLKNFRSELKNINLIYPIYWQNGAISVFFKKYNHFILLGEYFCVSTWIILILSKFSTKKIYLWTHGWYGNEGIIKKMVKKLFFKLADEILVYGNYSKELLIKNGIKKEKISVIYNSLDYDEQKIVREKSVDKAFYKRKFKNEDPTFIFIGRITKVKKLHLLIEVHGLLLKSGISSNFVIVGEGEELESLINYSKKMKTFSRTWFYGACYDENEIGKLLSNSVICVSPGNVGLTAIHSLMYGTPVITHSDFKNQMPEFESISSGVTGDFFERDSVQDLYLIIVKWLKNNVDRESVRNNCFEVVDKFYNPSFQYQVIEKVINSYDKK